MCLNGWFVVGQFIARSHSSMSGQVPIYRDPRSERRNARKSALAGDAPPTGSVGAGMPLLQSVDLNGRNGKPSGVNAKAKTFI